MKKLISILLALIVLVSCVPMAFAEEPAPTFTYELSLTDEKGEIINDLNSLNAGDQINLSIVVTRTDITEDSYDAYAVEFKVTTNGLSYNGDGVSFREGTSVSSVNFYSGRVTGIAYLDLALQGETVSNPLQVGSWSYTVEDPEKISLAVTTAIIYVTGAEEDQPPVEMVSLTLDAAGGTITGTDVSGEYTKGTVVTLPSAARSGYDFDGWSDGNTVYPAGSAYTMNNSAVLSAVWSDTSAPPVPPDPPVVPDPPVNPDTPADDLVLDYEVPMLVLGSHINYIVGYTDGTIQPLEKITRAEVAMIFYRLLNDEYRTQYETTENNFPDVAETAWYNKAVSTLANAGILTGYTDGKFYPRHNITRAELVTIIDRFAEAVEGGSTVFTDVAGHWAYDSITTADEYDWINGYPDGTFRPNADITRAETVAVVNRLLGRFVNEEDHLLPNMIHFSDNMDTSKWYYYDIQEAANNHEYERLEASKYEKWTKLLPNIIY